MQSYGRGDVGYSIESNIGLGKFARRKESYWAQMGVQNQVVAKGYSQQQDEADNLLNEAQACGVVDIDSSVEVFGVI